MLSGCFCFRRKKQEHIVLQIERGKGQIWVEAAVHREKISFLLRGALLIIVGKVSWCRKTTKLTGEEGKVTTLCRCLLFSRGGRRMVTSTMVKVIAPRKKCGSWEGKIFSQILKVLANKDKGSLGDQLQLMTVLMNSKVKSKIEWACLLARNLSVTFQNNGIKQTKA